MSTRAAHGDERGPAPAAVAVPPETPSRAGFAAPRVGRGLRYKVVTRFAAAMVAGLVVLGGLLVWVTGRFAVEQRVQESEGLVDAMNRVLDASEFARGDFSDERKREAARLLVPLFVSRPRMAGIAFHRRGCGVLYADAPVEAWTALDALCRGALDLESATTVEADWAPDLPALHVLVPWYVRGRWVGVVQIGWDPAGLVASRLRQLLLVIVVAALFVGGVTLFGTLSLDRNVLSPLDALSRATNALAGGDFEAGERAALSVPAVGELGELVDRFRAMAHTIGEQSAALQERIAELERTRAQLLRVEKSAALGRMAAGIAHEIGNPLTSVQGYAEFLADGGLEPEEVRDMGRRIGEEARRIDRIVRSLLDYARPVPATGERTDGAALIVGTLELLRPQKLFRRMRLDLWIAPESADADAVWCPDPRGAAGDHRRTTGERPAVPVVAATLAPLWVRAEPEPLRQVLVNLCVNAAHACGGEGTISVRVFRDEPGAGGVPSGRVRIEVADDGPGVPPHLAEVIFDPFYTTKDVGEGTGLGLAISRRICEQFGDTLRVEASETTGAVFWFRLRPAPAPA